MPKPRGKNSPERGSECLKYRLFIGFSWFLVSSSSNLIWKWCQISAKTQTSSNSFIGVFILETLFLFFVLFWDWDWEVSIRKAPKIFELTKKVAQTTLIPETFFKILTSLFYLHRSSLASLFYLHLSTFTSRRLLPDPCWRKKLPIWCCWWQNSNSNPKQNSNPWQPRKNSPRGAGLGRGGSWCSILSALGSSSLVAFAFAFARLRKLDRFASALLDVIDDKFANVHLLRCNN